MILWKTITRAALLSALLFAPVRGADFSPRQSIEGCLLWLDAADLEADAPVAQWNDRSGQGNHAVQTDDAARPKAIRCGDRTLARFSAGAFLQNPLRRDWTGENWTVFAVASLDTEAPDAWRGIIGNRFGEGASHWWTLGTSSAGNLYLELCAGNGPATRHRLADAGMQILRASKAGNAFTLSRNGAVGGEGRCDNCGDETNALRIGRWFGAGQEWQGDIAEILIYDRALSAEEAGAVEAYLAKKWAVVFWPRFYEKQETWLATALAARERQATEVPAVSEGTEQPGEDLWSLLEQDFTEETAVKEMEREREDAIWRIAWRPGNLTALAARYAEATHRATPLAEKAAALAAEVHTAEQLDAVRALYHRSRDCADALACARGSINLPALRRAIEDLAHAFPDRYTRGPEFLKRLAEYETRFAAIEKALEQGESGSTEVVDAIQSFQAEALLANPLLDFDKILLVRRSVQSPGLGLVQNWQSNCQLPRSGFDDEIAVLSPIGPQGEITTLYEPANPVFVGDVDLHFDGERMLFSSIGTNNCWQIFEIRADGTGLRQVTPGDEPDVDNYDVCYLPDGRIVFTSSASMAAVPCVNGSTRVANLYIMNADGSAIRQLGFDQEHSWCPTVMTNGRVMYQRWEYTDTPHTHTRLMFHMNPDGTNQMELYGSNSYWPNALFYARPIPGDASKFIGIVSGHHGVARVGELVLFDPAVGRREADGAIQRIPGYGQKVEAKIEDNLVDASWPKFLHPYPLSEKYFLVSSQPTPESKWGIYLVDVFDNMLLLKEEAGSVLFEPVPLRATPTPPAIPDKVDLERRDAIVYLSDVYAGQGLKGVPRDAVKSLRLFSYHYLYPGMGGPQAVVGMEGPWDIKRILGTVPVEADGSAIFRIPANTPISIQPLDAEGKALQLMRSWLTAMPGETLSCVGCHESQNSSVPARPTLASRRAPSDIKPWRGPARGFNFQREVQPVLDRYCIGCHDGSERKDGKTIPNLREQKHITDYTSVFHSGGVDAAHFSIAYAELHRFVRRPGLESDYHMLEPMEFHADSTQLVQLLSKGHHGVHLNEEAWDRIITWIDLNAPYHGTWTEIAGRERVTHIAQRRRDLLKRYANMDDHPEAEAYSLPAVLDPDDAAPAIATVQAAATPPADWPVDAAEAKRLQTASGKASRSIDLGDGLSMQLTLVPAGEFLMGSTDGLIDEQPASRVRIEEPFWMGCLEVTNAQYARFDPEHDSRVESRFSMQFGVRGFYVNGPDQPVVRLSWREAMAFCDWLAERTGERFSLPTEAQWEYACRAGTATPFSYGTCDTDFSPYANLSDAKLREFVCHTYKKEREPWLNASKYDDWIPKDLRFNDGSFLADGVGRYQPNPWGLYDMHGNVAEWTRSLLRPYPYDEADGRNAIEADGRRVARGGSWRDCPPRARSAFRLAYRPYQEVYNVGFRVVCPARDARTVALDAEKQ